MTYMHITYFITDILNWQVLWGKDKFLLKFLFKKNERTHQRTHAQNHVYVNKSRHTYVCNVRQLLNPELWSVKDFKFPIWVSHPGAGENLRSSKAQ